MAVDEMTEPKSLAGTYPFGCYPCPTLADARNARLHLMRAWNWGALRREDYERAKHHIDDCIAKFEAANVKR